MPFDTGGKYTMESYKSEFIEFMVESDVLKFGDFTLKSGRKSPFFMNAGAYVTGSQLKKLGEYYAKAIHASYGDDFDVLFGPAYKGIPLAVVTAIAFSELYGKEIRYCSDRKEAKDHGADKGGFLGSRHPPRQDPAGAGNRGFRPRRHVHERLGPLPALQLHGRPRRKPRPVRPALPLEVLSQRGDPPGPAL